jgi:hypothetical protein
VSEVNVGVIQFDIRYPNGQRESAVVEGQRALIGSASHCDVRLPMDQAAYEHVLVEVVGATLRAEAKAEQPPATINGMPLTAGALAADSVLGVGRVRLFINYVADVADGGQASAGKKKDRSLGVHLALIALFGAAIFMLLVEPQTSIAAAPAEAPQLFGAPVAGCPRPNPGQALAYAQEQRDLADGKRERMPFILTDGVLAVGLYDTAAACFRAGGQEPSAKEAQQSARWLERELTNEFRARQLRLSHLLTVEDYELAKRDLSALRALTQGKQGRYVEWLDTVAKQLKAKEAKGAK